MAYEAGRNALLKYGSQSSPETYVTVGGLRNVDLTIDAGPVDVTNKDSGGFQEMLPGAGVWKGSITAQGLFKTGSASLASLISASNIPQQSFNAQVIFGNGDTYVGNWVVRSLKRTGTYQDAETYDISIESSGQVVFTSGS